MGNKNQNKYNECKNPERFNSMTVTNDKNEKTRWEIANSLWDIQKAINWDYNKALNYLKRFYTKVDTWIEWYWKFFNKVSIKLPKTNWFSWDSREFFVETESWNVWCNGKSFKKNNCDKYSFSKRDISNIKDSIRKFFISLWIDPYEKVDTFEEKYEIDRSEVCLIHLLWLPTTNSAEWWNKKSYRLKNRIWFFGSDYYMLTPLTDRIRYTQWLYDYWDWWQNDVWKLLLKYLPNQ